MENGVVPSASITAISRRRSYVAINIVFATPKMAMAKTMKMTTNLQPSASWA